MLPETFDFHGSLKTLASHNVRFVVIGGIAMGLHGSDYQTTDLDICYARDQENLAALASALVHHNPRLRGAPEDIPFIWDTRTLKNGLNFTLTTEFGSLDLLGEPAGIDTFEGLWNRASTADLGDFSVRVASLEDLIAMKQAAGRPKDLNHLLELKALLKAQPG